MNTSKVYVIKLLSKDYEIKCLESEKDNLQKAADKLNALLLDNKKKFKSLDAFQILLLAALNLSGELLRAQTQQKQQRQELAEFISTLTRQIQHFSLES